MSRISGLLEGGQVPAAPATTSWLRPQKDVMDVVFIMFGARAFIFGTSDVVPILQDMERSNIERSIPCSSYFPFVKVPHSPQ